MGFSFKRDEQRTRAAQQGSFSLACVVASFGFCCWMVCALFGGSYFLHGLTTSVPGVFADGFAFLAVCIAVMVVPAFVSRLNFERILRCAQAHLVVALAAVFVAVVVQVAPLCEPPLQSALQVAASAAFGLVMGIGVHWYIAVWAAQYASSSKRAVFIALMLSASAAAIVWYGLLQGGYPALVACVLAVVSTGACWSVRGETITVLDDILEGGVEGDVYAKVARRGRPLATINAGVVLVVWMCLVADASYDGYRSLLCVVALIVTSGFLCVVASAGKTIPKIGSVDFIVNFTVCVSFAATTLGVDAVSQLGMFLVVIAVALYILALVSNVALIVPALQIKPSKICRVLVLNLICGMALGLIVLCVMYALGFDQELCSKVLTAFVIVLCVAEPSLFPYKNELVQEVYNYANECDVGIDGEQDVSCDVARDSSMHAFDETCAAIAEKYGLTPRERELFVLLARGHSTKAISEKLFISVNTVKTHTYSVYRKLGVNKRDEVIDLLERAFSDDDR